MTNGRRARMLRQQASGISAQNPDGTYSPVEPMGWREEHNWLARLIFWLRRIEHCNAREGQRKR